MATRAKESGEILIMEVQRGEMNFCILGTSPLIMNTMAKKAWEELLFPKGKMTASDKAQGHLKHDPIKEFRSSPYYLTDPKAPTLLAVLPTALKKAMATAALDTPGAKKAQIGRLVEVDWDRQPVYGIPKVFMAITRNKDMDKTPDVRTRAILPEWACRLTVRFPKPMLKEQSIANLLAAAGRQCGVGDWRQEKGSGSFGAFRLVAEDDPDFVRIVKAQGRKAQQEAIENPQAYDDETSDMLAWFNVELKKRGFKVEGDNRGDRLPESESEKDTKKRRKPALPDAHIRADQLKAGRAMNGRAAA